MSPNGHGDHRLPMTLTQYLDAQLEATQSTREAFPAFVAILDELAAFFDDVAQSVRDTKQATIASRLVELILFHDARRFWLSGCASWMRQHFHECLPPLRSALETAAYARKISQNPGLNEVWLHRGERQREFNAAFRVGGIEQRLFPTADPVARRLWGLFDMASMYGVHANHERLAYTLEIVDGGAGQPRRVLFNFGLKDATAIMQMGGICLAVAVRIIEVFEHVLQDVTGQMVWTIQWRQLQGRAWDFAKRHLAGRNIDEV